MRSARPENLQDSQPGISNQLELGQHRQRAEVELNFTNTAGFRTKVDVSNSGLLSIAALVSSILVSTAVLVHVATRDARLKSLWR
ncbi:hypothetical protein [Rhizobium bangladeshense]|uniref:hypothetical protein n=1 Tax=Rhizobium bangladeshense TaxID=1138189 RepID=UPI0007E577B5|nr:hypothetical protein [Rhizobium bangladeshense]